MTIYHDDVLTGITIPESVRTLSSFREWARSATFPEEGRICYLGEVWIEMSKEQLFTHNGVKTEFTIVLGGMARSDRSGRYFTDGVRFSNEVADLSTVPDGLFVSWSTVESKGVELIEASGKGFIEIEGSPDMCLEVVSNSSVRKDTNKLVESYWKAGVTEYWLVDARDQSAQFTIYGWEPDGFVPKEAEDGWIHSAVFGKAFQLVQSEDPGGNPEYQLAVR